MSSPDSSQDFSHLPTVDEARSSGGDASKLWEKHRRTAGQAPAAQPPAAPPAVPQQAAEEIPPQDAQAWQSLLEMDVDEQPLMEYQRPAARPVAKPAEAPRKRSIIRAPAKPAVATAEQLQEEPVVEEPVAAAPEAPRRQRSEPAKDVAAKDPAKDVAAKDPAQDDKGPDVSAVKEGDAVPKPAVTVETVAAPKSPWQHRWEKVGGAALGLSVGIHLLVLGAAAFYVAGKVMEPQVDFLPGGGTAQNQAASQALENKIQQKKNPWLKKSMPIRRLASLDKVSDIALPDAPEAFELPDAANQLLKSKVGAGMGLAGAGGGFGSGMGLGSRSGMVFQPLSMFGRKINARKMALVLDVSTSMAPHLPRVIAEVDKVAKDSVVVLYFGCGLEPPPPGRGLDGDEIYRTSGQEFEKFWRMGGPTLEDARKFKFNPKDVIPMEEVFRLLSRRPQTYFIHGVGLGYTWLALLSNEVRSADALYWFSDFQDRVDFKQIGVVRENLMNRKQKLYIHAYQRGSAFDLVVSQLVEPTNGGVIEEEE
jgi:hypothetical protein